MSPRLSLLFVLGVLLFSPFAPQEQNSTLKRTQVHGTVRDVNGAWVTETVVTLRSVSSSYEVKTNGTGYYSVFLPAGTYALSARKPGFCTLRRGEFIATGGQQIDFDLQLWVCPTDAYGWSNYAELTEANSSELKPLIFGREKSADDYSVFTGSGFTVPEYPAVLTFNRFTFIAESFTYMKARKVMVAKGKVTWYKDSDKSNHASEIEIRFDGNIPRVKILTDASR